MLNPTTTAEPTQFLQTSPQFYVPVTPLCIVTMSTGPNNSHPSSGTQGASAQDQPPKLDTAALSSGPGTNDLVPEEVTSPTKAAGAKRAMSAAASWKPVLDRRQSWDAQEHKHAMMMTRISDVQAGPGFSESK